MSARQPRLAVGRPVGRGFVFTRLQAQSIALAYQALIPTVSRPSGSSRPHTPVQSSMQTRRSQVQAGG
jgi:hypothetical protein